MRTEPPEAFRSKPSPDPTAPGSPAAYDPLRLCIYTTITLIAWVVTPPAAAMVFSALGLAGYLRAYRAGLTRSRCLLGDTRLVLAYLAVVLVASTAVTIYSVLGRLGLVH